jgi:hypothetical protein
MDPIITRVNPAEFFRGLNANVYRAAFERGQSLSAFLDEEHPQTEYKDGLDGFSRMLKMAGIKVRAFPSSGLYADKVESFFKNEQTRTLFPEFCNRKWREVIYGPMPDARALYSDSDDALNTVPRPIAAAAQGRWDKRIQAAIPSAALIAMTTPIDGDAYKAYYLTDNPAQQRKVRVGSTAEIPTAKLTGGEREVRLWKFGRALEMSYEQVRRMRIDKLAMHVQKMSVQAEIDRVATIIDVLVNGDGNSGTAPTSYNLTTLDSGTTSGVTTLKAWLAFKMKFANPYQLLVALTQDDVALKLMLLNSGSGNVPLSQLPANVTIGSFKAINPGLADGSGLGWTADAPANKVVGVDTRFAVERVVEIGSNIQEMDKFIKNQTELLVMSEVEGYSIMDGNATKILVNNA